MARISDQVGTRIKAYRQRAGLTQEALAFHADMHVSFISEIERGLKKPSIESLEKLLFALNVSFVEFFDLDDTALLQTECPALDKLNLALRGRSNTEIEMLYDVIKQILQYNDRK